MMRAAPYLPLFTFWLGVLKLCHVCTWPWSWVLVPTGLALVLCLKPAVASVTRH